MLYLKKHHGAYRQHLRDCQRRLVGGGLFGFDISSLSAQLAEQSYLCYFNQTPYGAPNSGGPHSLVQGGITASMAAGSWLGALFSGPISDRIGRKYSIMMGCLIW